MFCRNCGSELRKDALFCTKCGTKVEKISSTENVIATGGMQVTTVNDKQEDSKKKSKKGIWIVLLIVILLCAIGTGIFFVKTREKKEVFDDMEETLETVVESVVEETEEETEIAEEEPPHEVLVCAPVEYMSLRKTPGLGEDVVTQLTAGTYLKWYGEMETVDEQEFYKVKVRENDQEGYVAAKYCIPIEFEFDESALNVVETETALYTYDMMVEDIETLCAMYPDRLKYNVISKSADERKIYKIVLGNPDAENQIMLQASIHGREYMTSQLVMKMIEYYAYYYDTASFKKVTYRDIFEKTAFQIIPMSNPDGVVISQQGVEALNNDYFKNVVYDCYKRDKKTLVYEVDSNGDMNWVDYYKTPGFNRAKLQNDREITYEEYQTIWKANANGVDLNNNFDAGWAEIQLKTLPAYGSFKGNSPLSEAESAALASIARKKDFRCFISYHSRGQLIYYDVKGNSPENSKASLDFANLLESWIKYEPVNTNMAYNVNLGGFGDWVQLSLNKPSVTIESGKRPCPLQADEFPAMWYRHRESWAMLGEQFYQ